MTDGNVTPPASKDESKPEDPKGATGPDPKSEPAPAKEAETKKLPDPKTEPEVKANPAVAKIDELIAQLTPDKSEGAQNAVGLLKGARTWLSKK